MGYPFPLIFQPDFAVFLFELGMTMTERTNGTGEGMPVPKETEGSNHREYRSRKNLKALRPSLTAQDIEEAKTRHNLVELIGARVKLTRAGKEYKGLCPFHNEHTPSFTVTPDKGMYFCFGCGAKGDPLIGREFIPGASDCYGPDRSGAFTGMADGKQGLLSFWFKLDDASNDNFNMTILCNFDNNTGYIGIKILRTNERRIRVYAKSPYDGDQMEKLILETVDSYVASSALWRHFMASWDMAGNSHVYVDGIPTKNIVTYVNCNLAYTFTGYSPGWQCWDARDGYMFLGSLAEFYFTNTYLDLSIQANREKFLKNNKPVFLGNDGSVPIGVAPKLFFSRSGSEATSAFGINKGSGGAFTGGSFAEAILSF
jgi:hypothetical protein